MILASSVAYGVGFESTFAIPHEDSPAMLEAGTKHEF
jgi:hypothetical protein